MRASLLAARELYERLVHWDRRSRANRTRSRFQFIPVTGQPPDTNIVCFLIKARGSPSLTRMNAVGEAVYRHFTIHAGTREQDYIYTQPFFLSRTRFERPQYSFHSVEDLLRRAKVDAAEYPERGIFVLRATVMSPYIVLNAETGHKQSYLADFMDELARTAERVLESGAADGDQRLR
jgi:hypothetical protein